MINATVKITEPPSPPLPTYYPYWARNGVERLRFEPAPLPTYYPYWARNNSGGLFLVTTKNTGICVTCWTTTIEIAEDFLTRLPVGTKIELTVTAGA